MRIEIFRQACCAADDQSGKLETVYEVNSGTTLEALIQKICLSDFLQYSSTSDRLSVEVEGRKLAEIDASGDTIWSPDVSPSTPVGLAIGRRGLHFVFRLNAGNADKAPSKPLPPENSSSYQIGATMLDRRMYGGIGSFLGLGLAMTLLNTILESFYFDRMEKGLICLFCIVAGLIAGRIIVWMKWRSL